MGWADGLARTLRSPALVSRRAGIVGQMLGVDGGSLDLHSKATA